MTPRPSGRTAEQSTSDDPSALDVLTNYLEIAGADEPRRSAGALLRQFGSVGRVLCASTAQLANIVGPNIAALIRGSKSLVQSSLSERVKDGPVLASREEFIRYLQLQLGSLRHERVLALYLDQKLRLLHSARISEGSVSSASADIARIIHIALDVGASAILVAHNHPSGDPTPSGADRAWTTRLERIAADLQLRLVDHIIIAAGQFRSLRDPTPET